MMMTLGSVLGSNVDVKSVGATGDGKTVDTVAIQKAIDQVAQSGGGEVDLPAGAYLSGSLELKSNVILNIEKGATLQGTPVADDYPIVTARWEGIELPCHRALISALNAENITIKGEGTVAGSPVVGKLRNPRGPTLIEPISCKNVRIEGITVTQNNMWTIHPTYCEDVVISHVTFETVSWNSDGIDPDSSRRVTIDGCTFSTGDDNIAIKSGKGQEGVKMNRPCEDITITNCTFIKGYSSIALGSELSGGIRRVTISNCTFQNGRAALYLKSRHGRAGFIDTVTASHLVVGPEPLLEIQTTYSSNADSQGVPGKDGITNFSKITVSDVTLNSKGSVTVNATAEKPVDGLVISNVAGTAKTGIVIRNSKNVELSNVHLDGVTGPTLSTENVQGTGLDGAVPAPAEAAAKK